MSCNALLKSSDKNRPPNAHQKSLLIVGSSATVTIHNPLSSSHPWRAGGAIAEMLTSLAWKTFTPCCQGKNIVVYPLFANVDMLMSALWRIPGTTTASLAPLERARVDSSAVFDAGSSDPLAVTTNLLDGPVSCIPPPELTNVLDAPESNMACVIASSIALASSCLDARSTFQHLSRRPQRCADVAMGLGPESATGRASSL